MVHSWNWRTLETEAGTSPIQAQFKHFSNLVRPCSISKRKHFRSLRMLLTPKAPGSVLGMQTNKSVKKGQCDTVTWSQRGSCHSLHLQKLPVHSDGAAWEMNRISAHRWPPGRARPLPWLLTHRFESNPVFGRGPIGGDCGGWQSIGWRGWLSMQGNRE